MMVRSVWTRTMEKISEHLSRVLYYNFILWDHYVGENTFKPYIEGRYAQAENCCFSAFSMGHKRDILED